MSFITSVANKGLRKSETLKLFWRRIKLRDLEVDSRLSILDSSAADKRVDAAAASEIKRISTGTQAPLS